MMKAIKRLMNCKVCCRPTKQVISFGSMPTANGFLTNLSDRERCYNLSLQFCPKCYMAQLEQVPPPEMLFNQNYSFISSTSKTMALHFKKQAEEIISLISKQKSPFVVELGCNDGIMLKHIATKKIKHLGVEPASNVASLARKNNVRVLEKFFNETIALQLVKEHGQADVICGSNVFCHIENINSVFSGINTLLKDDGIVFFEDPYILDIVKKTSFDQIYDEHIYLFSGLSIKELAKRHNLQLVDMKHQNVHGGSMRYYLKKGKNNKQSKRISSWITKEKKLKLNRIQGYKHFKNNIDQICKEFTQTLKRIKHQDKQIVGYGATSKSTTILNYTKIGPDTIDYIVDNTPTKIGKFTPGMHIPVKNRSQFNKDKPPYTVLFAWNHKQEILLKEKKYRKHGGKFILYFPKVSIQ